jgi:hypothetical protein
MGAMLNLITINERLTLDIPFQTEENIGTTAKFFNDATQCAGWNATPEHKRALIA